MNILHFADLHATVENRSQTGPALASILGICRERKPDLAVLAGDLSFTKGKSDWEEVALLRWFLEEMASMRLTIVVPGNHDLAHAWDRVDFPTALMGHDLAHAWDRVDFPTAPMGGAYSVGGRPAIIIQSRPGRVDARAGGQHAYLYCVPYVSKYNFLAKDHGLTPEQVNAALSARLGQIVMAFGAEAGRLTDAPSILVYHGLTSGGQADNEMVMSTDHDIALDRGAIPESFCAVMAGHLHKPQRVGRVVYPGAIAPLTHTKRPLEPSVCIWHIEKADGDPFVWAQSALHDPGQDWEAYTAKGWISLYERIPIPVAHQLLEVEISSDFTTAQEGPEPTLNGVTAHVLDQIGDPETYADAKVRIRGSLPAEIVDLIDEAEIREYLRGAHQVHIAFERVFPSQIRVEGISKHLGVHEALDLWLNENPDPIIHSPNPARTRDAIDEFAKEVEEAIPAEMRIEATGSHWWPIRGWARNWKQYEEAEIDFSALDGLTVIVGPNDGGKSNLMKGIMLFTLFKDTLTGVPLGALVRHGQKSAETGLEIGVGDPASEWRHIKVVRSIKLRGDGSGAGDLILAEKINGEWVPLNLGKANETQAELEKLVGSRDLYLATSFAAQGQVDHLLSLKPAPLKDLLQEAVSSKVYPIRAEIAGKAITNLTETIERNRKVGESVAEKAAELPDREKEAEEIRGALEANRKETEGIRTHQEEIAASVADLDARIIQTKRALEILGSKQAELEGLQKEGKRRLADLDVVNREIASLVEVEHNGAELDNMRTTLADLRSRQRQVASVRADLAEYTEVREEFEAKKGEALEGHRARTQAQCDKALEQIALLEWRVGEFRRTQDGLVERARNEREHAVAALSNAKQEAALLESVHCVDLERGKGQCEFLDRAAKAEGLIPDLTIAQEKAGADAERDADRLAEQIRATEEEIVSVREFVAKLGAAPLPEFPEWDSEISTATTLVLEQEALLGEIADPDQRDVERLIARIAVIEAGASTSGQRAALEERKRILSENVAQAAEAVEEKQKEILRSQPAENVEDLLKDLAEFRACASVNKELLGVLERARGKLSEGLGTAEERVRQALEAVAELGRLSRFLDTCEEQLIARKIYKQAVGRDGIPFLILEHSLPTLEAYTNELISAGQNGNPRRIEIEPVRDLQTGKAKDEVVIWLHNHHGVCPISESGGYGKMSIGYGLSFALGRLVQEVIGSATGHAFADEGFGAADQENILRAQAMMRRLAEERGRMFVISHVPAIAAVADHTIVVNPGGGNGSTVEVE